MRLGAEFFTDGAVEAWDEFLSEFESHYSNTFQKHGIPKQLALVIVLLSTVNNSIAELTEELSPVGFEPDEYGEAPESWKGEVEE